MIPFVNQKTACGCGIACAAMVAECSFDHVQEVALAGLPRYAKLRDGLYTNEMVWLLSRLGVKAALQRYPDFNRLVPHLVTAPSLNGQGLLHNIVITYVDGQFTVYDPQWKRRGKLYYARDKKDTNGVQLKAWSEVFRIVSNSKRVF